MIIILQRVSQASVMIDNSIHSSIQKGFVALVGFQPDDSDEDLAFMVRKITNIRIFDLSRRDTSYILMGTLGS